MKTQLVRNALTLNDLDRLKTKMDDDINESIMKIVNDFEKQTQVAVKTININWNTGVGTMATLKDYAQIKVDLF